MGSWADLGKKYAREAAELHGHTAVTAYPCGSLAVVHGDGDEEWFFQEHHADPLRDDYESHPEEFKSECSLEDYITVTSQGW